MSLVVFLPLVAWFILGFFAPTILTSVDLPVPESVIASLSLVLVVAGFFRQWQWFYWCAWTAGFYAVIQLGLQQPLSQQPVTVLYEALPVWLSLTALLLALIKLPVLFSMNGFLLFIAAGLSPFLLLIEPFSGAVGLLNPSKMLSLAGEFPGVGTALWMMAMGGVWATTLLYRQASAFRWSQLVAWLALMVFVIGVKQTEASMWAVLVVSVSFLLALADRMLKLAYIDELTGLPQRRALMSELRYLRKRSAVCMLDVDHFKKFNDRYGHEVGDQVLRLLGSILKSVSGFKAYRYGGEEFTLVFSNNNEEKLKDVLETVRSKVANYPLALRDPSRPKKPQKGKEKRGKQSDKKTVKVTISLGATIKAPGDTPDSILKRADENLYAAKKAGRNRVILKN
ncbi:GGDEF domain-containing protein [Idiomarina piscisalsi]|uniref:diguanylate cyclase n=1 Tax=Idiomarina piscisalsi TaxID=1096243 RepID=A0ABN5AR92_9GAMM|nr:GGDEF domain-containing protein [Idiomarina piscisalsi]ASG64893.1 GGDEF domain-containing protein [Idiomarina piscisalsi]